MASSEDSRPLCNGSGCCCSGLAAICAISSGLLNSDWTPQPTISNPRKRQIPTVNKATVVKNNDTILLGISGNKSFEVGRAHGVSDKDLKIELDPGWTYAYKYYQGKKLGGFYLVNAKSLEELLVEPAKSSSTNASAGAPSGTQGNTGAPSTPDQPSSEKVDPKSSAPSEKTSATADSTSKNYTCSLQVIAEQMGQKFDGQMTDYVFYNVPIPNTKAAKIDETISVGTTEMSSSKSDGSDGLPFTASESGAAWNVWKGKTKTGTDLKLTIDVLSLKFKVNLASAAPRNWGSIRKGGPNFHSAAAPKEFACANFR